jgi:hypothetical protein
MPSSEGTAVFEINEAPIRAGLIQASYRQFLRGAIYE